MPLIVCPECNHKISSYSEKCIYCGCPMSVIKKLLGKKQTTPKKQTKKAKTKKEKVVKTPEPKARPESFIKSRNKNDVLLMSALTSLFKEKVPNIEARDSSYMYMYKVLGLPDDVPNTLCWFSKNDDNELVFKYYRNPLTREEQQQKKVTSIESVKQCANIAINAYNTFYLSKVSKIEKPEEDDYSIFEEDDEETGQNYLILYTLIITAVKGKNVKADNATKELCGDIAHFVLNEVAQNAIRQKDFKNMDDFNTYKYARRYTANFFGHYFSFRHLKESDAEEFYLYYKASILVNVIKKQESLLKKEIIFDYDALIKSLYKMIKYNEIDYSRANGLLSTFSIVPEQLLDRELERLNKFEK